MADQFFESSSYPKLSSDDYNEEEDYTEGEYEDEVNDVENDEKTEELACPFCLEDFDVLGLCCHIDADHRIEVKPGICPFCSTKVGINMASHVITQHENVLKTLCLKKHCSSRSRSAMHLFRKELLEKHMRSIKDSSVSGASDEVADSMLLSFVNNPQLTYKPQNESASTTESTLPRKGLNDDPMESIHPTPITERKNKTDKCEFMQGLVLSTIFDDL